MAQDTTPTAGPEPAPQPPRRLRRHARRLGRWMLLLVVAGGLLAGAAVLAMVGQRLDAPEWVRARIETRIEQSLGGMQIEFGDVSLVINKGWRPRVRLRDVMLMDETGQLVAQLSDAEASLAMRPLLRGRVQPKHISLNGALAVIRRGRDGKVALSLGGANAPVNQAEGLPQLIESWDRVFLRPQFAALTAVEIEGISLRYEDAGQGRAWTLDGGAVLLERRGEKLALSASFSLLSGREYASTIEASYTSVIGDARAEFGMSVRDIPAQDIAAQNVALGWLEVLRAPISGALRGGVEADGRLAPLSATLQIGAGVLQPLDQASPVPFSGARSYFTYTPETGLLRFDELSVSSDWGSGTAEGRAWLGGIRNGRLSDLTGQFTLTGLRLNPAGVYPEPLLLEGVEADFRLELDPFRLRLGQMRVADKGGDLLLSGALDADAEGWHLALDGRMDRLTTERLVALWPEGAAPKPRKWVRKNLLGGIGSDLSFSLRAEPGVRPVISAGFAFRDATIRFMKTLPPITGAAGHATLNGGRFVVTATKGQVIADEGGAVDVAGTSFIIPDVTIKGATPGVVRVRAEGSVTSALSLLDRPPLRVMKDTPLPVDVVDGRARIEGTLSLPLKDKVQVEELQFHFAGEITGASSDLLVPGLHMAAPRLRITGDQTGLDVSGRGRIGEVPVSVTWHRPIGKGAGKASRVTGEIEISPKVVETFSIGLPEGTVSGRGTGRFTLDLAPGRDPHLSLESDLAGVGLRLAPLGWSKPPSATGQLALDARLGKQTRVDRLLIKAAGLAATGTVLNRPGGGLERALFASVRMGGWLDARVELVGRGDAPPLLRVLGGTLDMRKVDFSAPSGGGGGQTGPLQVNLDRLQVTDTIALTGFTGEFSTARGLEGPFRGRLNGQTEVSGNLVPRGARSAVLVESADAGGVFRAAGLLTQAHGGDFRLSLLPVADGPGQYDGTLRITNTRVKDAPAIAALLNAISVVGLLDEMAGQGILFTEVDARFRLGPSRLVLYESSAVGPSIGLSMDGVYDVPAGVLDMQGAISPLYLLNGIGSVLTRKGEGVLGFNYTLRGPSSDPEVQVNPLSALAPAMLRDVLREAPPEDPAGGGKGSRRTPRKSDGPVGSAVDDR